MTDLAKKPLTAQQLRRWRTAKGITQAAAAEWWGCTEVSWWRWEAEAVPVPLTLTKVILRETE